MIAFRSSLQSPQGVAAKSPELGDLLDGFMNAANRGQTVVLVLVAASSRDVAQALKDSTADHVQAALEVGP